LEEGWLSVMSYPFIPEMFSFQNILTGLKRVVLNIWWLLWPGFYGSHLLTTKKIIQIKTFND
jgi:hypothetical protein